MKNTMNKNTIKSEIIKSAVSLEASYINLFVQLYRGITMNQCSSKLNEARLQVEKRKTKNNYKKLEQRREERFLGREQKPEVPMVVGSTVGGEQDFMEDGLDSNIPALFLRQGSRKVPGFEGSLLASIINLSMESDACS